MGFDINVCVFSGYPILSFNDVKTLYKQLRGKEVKEAYNTCLTTEELIQKVKKIEMEDEYDHCTNMTDKINQYLEKLYPEKRISIGIYPLDTRDQYHIREEEEPIVLFCPFFVCGGDRSGYEQEGTTTSFISKPKKRHDTDLLNKEEYENIYLLLRHKFPKDLTADILSYTRNAFYQKILQDVFSFEKNKMVDFHLKHIMTIDGN